MRTKCIVVLFLLSHCLASAQGTAFTYQGRLAEGGTSFTGMAEIQFTLWDSATNGSQVAATIPGTMTVPVTNGLFGALLDFGAARFPGADRWLQLQVRTGGATFTTLMPRQLLTPVPYSIHSANASSASAVTGPVPDALLSSNVVRLDGNPVFTGSVTAASFAGNGAGLSGITHLDSAAAGPTSAVSVDAQGRVAIGTNDSGAALQVTGGGTFPLPVFLTAVVNGSGGISNMLDVPHVFISGNRAFVTSYSPGSLQIFDVSNPAQPVLLGQAVDNSVNPSSPFQRLAGAQMVFVTNDVAYITAEADNALTIMNVSNPANPTKLAEVVHGVGGVLHFQQPVGVVVWSNKVFVTAQASSSLSVFDISNPSVPVLVNQLLDDSVDFGSFYTRLGSPFHMKLAGTTLFVAARGDHAINIFSVTNPANPRLIREIFDTTASPSEFTALRAANWIDVAGNLAVVAAGAFEFGMGGVTLLDISNPANPIKLAELKDETVQNSSPFTRLNGAWAAKIVGNLLFVSSFQDNAVTVIDISIPTQPKLIKEFVHNRDGIDTLRFPQGIATKDDIVYVAGGWSAAVNLLQLESSLGLVVENSVGIGTSTPRTALDVAGTITATQLNVENGMRVTGNWNGEQGALEVLGDKPTIRFTGGVLSGSQSWLLHVGSDGPGNFGFYRRDPFGGFPNMMTLSTSGNLGLGTVQPAQKLHASGTESRLRLESQGATAYSATEYAASSRTWHTGVGGSSAGAVSSKYYITDTSAGQIRMVIDTAGNVGIGTTTPGAALDVRTTSATGNAIRFGFHTGGEGHLIAGPSRVGIATGDGTERISIPQGTGNVGLGTLSPSAKLHVIGSILASGTITPNSDVNAKTNFAPVDTQEILERVVRLPIQKWRFKAEADEVKHVGPMAQDFREAFGLGEFPNAIATVDADGVALAAIQGLNEKLEARNNEIEDLKRQVSELRRAFEKLSGGQK